MSPHDPTGDDPIADNPTADSPTLNNPSYPESTPSAPAANPWGPAPQPAPPAAEWPGYSGGFDSAGYGGPGTGSSTQSPYQASDPGSSPHYGAPSAPYPSQQGYGSDPHLPNPSQQGYGSNPYEMNPYQPQYGSYSPYGVAPQQHPQATTAMILGIVGMTVCPPVGIAGLVLGNKVRRQIDAEPQSYTGRGMATAGFVLGIISCVMTATWVLVLLVGFGGLLGGS